MFRNYLKTTWRNLQKNKTFSLINIIGLAMSMSVCLLIIMVIADQKSYDRFHSNKDRIYRVLTKGKNGNFMRKTAFSALPLADALKNEFSGVETTASLVKNIGGDVVYNQKFASGGGYFADGNLFKIMDFQLAQGDANTALSEPFSIVLTGELASQLFYNENPIGKIVKFNDKGINPSGPGTTNNKETEYGQFKVTGVLKPIPGKTSLPFKLLASLSTVQSLTKDSILSYSPNNWDNVSSAYTYVLMQKGKTKADLQSMLNKISDRQYPKGFVNQYAFEAQALHDITPSEPMGGMTNISIPPLVLIILSMLGLIVMLSACLNYTNLSIARLLTRAKEVGIRKVSGATRKQIFGQFITESVMVSLLSLFFSIVILFFLEKLFTGLHLNQYLNITFSYSISILLIFVAFSLLVGFIAGILPAFYISSFNPVHIFKRLNNIKLFRRLTLRKVLLVIQFTVSLFFIISTALIYMQTNHVLHFNYGFDENNVVNIKLYKTENYARYAHAIASNKDIRSLSACAFLPATGFNRRTFVHRSDDMKDSLEVNYNDIDAKCIDVWGLKLIAGKNLPGVPAEPGEQYILVNETLVADFNYPSPAAALGQRIVVEGNNLEIAGVVKDFQFLDVTRKMEPLMLRNRQSKFGYVTVKISGRNTAATLGFLESTWKSLNPDTKFEYEFFDQQLLIVHSTLKDIALILGLISFLAVLISCLGLLGMATYTAETKQKEIGIRKVLGANVGQIMMLLSKGFMILLGFAALIASPLAIIVNSMWLNYFASRVSISPPVLLMSIGALLLVSLMIVFSQGRRVSVANPVKSLRTE